MAIEHAEPGEAVDILGPKGAAGDGTVAIFKTQQLEVIRMAIPEGKQVPSHRVNGEITVQCMQGRVAFSAPGGTQVLKAGQILHLVGGDEHAIRGLEDATLLVTIVLV